MKRLACITFLAIAGPAVALSPLSSVGFINTGLRDVMIADQLRIACPDLSARLIKGWAFVRSLEKQARDLGYSKDEIKDFVESKKERKRIEGAAATYMKANGVVSGKPETYCALGREEISKGSQIGSFLSVK
ncbi:MULTISPECIES: DUF5333 domain-containing protein [unclassified Marinovum]